MKTVIKYNNRKLYDKETAKYTSIVELVQLPLGSFKVEKHSTGEDITIETLLTAVTNKDVENKTKLRVIKHCVVELETGATL